MLSSILKQTIYCIHSIESTRNKVIVSSLFRELGEKHHVEDAAFLADGNASLIYACHHHDHDFRYEGHGIETTSNMYSKRYSKEYLRFQTVFATQKKKLPMSGYDSPHSHGIN
jgi:hypothetical protein